MSKNKVIKDYKRFESNYTEFGYIEGYYLKISYSQGLVICAYNLDLLDGKRFESQMSLTNLHKLYYKFK